MLNTFLSITVSLKRLPHHQNVMYLVQQHLQSQEGLYD